jgi:hypothetical protein
VIHVTKEYDIYKYTYIYIHMLIINYTKQAVKDESHTEQVLMYIFVIFYLFACVFIYFWQYQGLNVGPHAC